MGVYDGLMFVSDRYANYVVPVKGPVIDVWRDGMMVKERKPLDVEFGGDSMAHFDPDTGDSMKHEDGVAMLTERGHAFDLDYAAAQNEWTAEDKEIVARTLLGVCRLKITEDNPLGEPNTHFPDFRLAEAPVPVAPWATYDRMEANRIAPFAAELEALPAALAYEQATHKRAKVVAALQAKIAEQADEQALTASA